ncbi:hypothetical protein N7492_002284 [Penicillium capsulatum]|uniref:Uncharacterized protein n=1 Tax=Penicillium capsulatum TaxID=69766 RepID=A0A9W9IJR6_9EURO|nr:hypothetical protein N7492_002284 [Penicillium capsulatum]KAJ6123110.1 hypothetical protein N7512_005575 [Penicillium capsulatum]
MPSAPQDSSSKSLQNVESAALSVRSPGAVENYYQGTGGTETSLIERGALSAGLLMLLPASIALASMAIYRSGATNMAFGVGTTILAILVNIWWFWWMEGWREFLWQMDEQRMNTKTAELNYQAKLQEMERNDQLHKPALEKATYDAQKARQDAFNQKWESKYLPKLEAEEHWADIMPDLRKKWEAAKEATDEAVGNGLNLDSRETKQKEAEKKYDEWKEAIDAWKQKAKEAIDTQELDSFDYQRDFWAMASGEGDSQNAARKVRRSRMARDGLPNLLHETCSSGLCQRVWYSNTLQESRKRGLARSEIIHRVYLTPTDYDFRAPSFEKRNDDYGYNTEDVECEGDGEDQLADKSFHTALELKGTGDGSDLEDMAKYIKGNQGDALHQIGEAINNGKKIKDKEGHEVTILAHEGWTCIAVTVNKKPVVWGLHGMFQDDAKLHDDHNDVWEDCRKKLKI